MQQNKKPLSQETINAFAYEYQIYKHAHSISDDFWDRVLSSPKPPVKVERKEKSIAYPITDAEWNEIAAICRDLKIQL